MPLLSLDAARKNRLRLEWESFRPVRPTFSGNGCFRRAGSRDRLVSRPAATARRPRLVSPATARPVSRPRPRLGGLARAPGGGGPLLRPWRADRADRLDPILPHLGAQGLLPRDPVRLRGRRPGSQPPRGRLGPAAPHPPRGALAGAGGDRALPGRLRRRRSGALRRRLAARARSRLSLPASAVPQGGRAAEPLAGRLRGAGGVRGAGLRGGVRGHGRGTGRRSWPPPSRPRATTTRPS